MSDGIAGAPAENLQAPPPEPNPVQPPAPPEPPEVLPPPEPPQEVETVSQAKVELEGLAAQIVLIAKSIPTPGVTDSLVHSTHLYQIAVHLKQIAEGL